MTVRDVSEVCDNIFDVFSSVVYYKRIGEFGYYYMGKFQKVKDKIMDCVVRKIYPSQGNGWGIDIDIMPPEMLSSDVEIIEYDGVYVNNVKVAGFNANRVSKLLYDNPETKYICYGVSRPEKTSIHEGWGFYFKEFMNELPIYEKKVTNGKHGNFILAFNFSEFFYEVSKTVRQEEDAKILKSYMINNGWIFDKTLSLVYKKIVV